MGIRYFEKPAAGYWMIAIGQAIFGAEPVWCALCLGAEHRLERIAGVPGGTPDVERTAQEPSLRAAVHELCRASPAQAGYANLDPQFTFWVNLSLRGACGLLSTALRARGNA